MLRSLMLSTSSTKRFNLLLLAACYGAVGCEATPPAKVTVESKQAPIIGGQLAPEEESVVGVVSLVPSGGGFGIGSCTGAIIADNVVLTAKHCVQDPEATGPRNPSNVFVVLGPQLSQTSPRFNVKSIVTTPGAYAEQIDASFPGKDVAVITLASSSGLKALPMKLTSPEDEKGKGALAIGYGQARGKDPSSPTMGSGAKYKVKTEVADVDELVLQVDDTTCQGDSGGPLLNEDGQIIGVVSYGPGSANMSLCVNGPGFYNRIDIHRKMILDAVAAAGDCGNDAAEVCDGFDNDCDKEVDETCADNGKTCADDLACKSLFCAETTMGSICTTPCDPYAAVSGCAEGFSCTARTDCTGVCVPGELGTKPFGAACETSAECATGFCHDPGTGTPTCLTTCKGGGSMCLFEEACVAGDGQCGSCVDDGLTAGKRGQDEGCNDKASCRSGVCFDDGGSKYCVNTCKADPDCDSAHHCRDNACVRGPRPSLGGRCEKIGDCSKGEFCVDTEQGNFCSQTCKSNADCGKTFACTKVANGSVCLPDGSVVGGDCKSDKDCVNGTCFTPSKTCTTPCSSPTDCGAGLECVRSAEGAPGLCLSADDAKLAPLGEVETEADAGAEAPAAKKSSEGCSLAQGNDRTVSWLSLAGLGLVIASRRRRRSQV